MMLKFSFRTLAISILHSMKVRLWPCFFMSFIISLAPSTILAWSWAFVNVGLFMWLLFVFYVDVSDDCSKSC